MRLMTHLERGVILLPLAHAKNGTRFICLIYFNISWKVVFYQPHNFMTRAANYRWPEIVNLINTTKMEDGK